MENTGELTTVYPFPATSTLISVYRDNYTVEMLTRIHNVTGKAFGVSGDSLLRHERNMLKMALNEAYGKHRPEEGTMMLKVRLNDVAAEIGRGIYGDSK